MKPGFDKKLITAFVIISLMLLTAAFFSVRNNERCLAISEELQGTNLLMKNLEDVNWQLHELISEYKEYAVSKSDVFLKTFHETQDELKLSHQKLLFFGKDNPKFKDEISSIVNRTAAFNSLYGQTAIIIQKGHISEASKLIASANEGNQGREINEAIAQTGTKAKAQLRILEKEQQQLVVTSNSINYVMAILCFIIILVVFRVLQSELNKRKKATDEINYLNSFISEKELSDTVINSLPGIFYVNNAEGKMLRWNKNFEIVTGYSNDELKTMRARDFFDAANHRLVLKMKEIAFTEGAIDFEAEFITKDRKKIPHYFTGRRLMYRGVPAILGVGIDITDMKKAEEQIITEKDLSDSIVNSLPGVFYLYDENRKFLRWNKNFETVSGYSYDEVSKMHPLNFFEGENKEILEQRISKVFETGQAEVEADFVTKNGERHCYYFNGKMVNYQNKRCLIGVGIDIEARKKAESLERESEAKYRSVVENSPDIIMTLDLDERVQFINYTGGGFTIEQVIGSSAYNFVDEQFHHLVKQKHAEVIATKANESYETISKGADGVSRWFFTNAAPIITADKVTGITLITRDITQRKKAAEELEKSFSILEATLESTADGILVADNEGNIIRFNKKFEQLWRLPVEILVSKDDDKALAFVLDQLIHPESFIAKVKELYAQPEAVSFDVLEFKDGRTFERYSQPQLINGKHVGRVWSFRDVTQNKRAEAEIIKTNTRFEKISKATNDALWEWDFISNQLWANETHQKLFGLSMSDPVPTVGIWKEHIHPEDKDKVVDLQARSLVSNDSLFISEYRFLNADNEYRNIYDRCFILRDPSGLAISMIGSMMDITEQKKIEKELAQSETRLRTILQTDPECIKLLTAKGELLEMNPAGLAMIEVDDFQQVAGHVMTELIDEKYRAQFNKLTNDVFRGKEGRLEFEITGLKGTHRWLETHAVPLRDSEGKIISLLGVTRDVTEHKKAEDELKASHSQLQQLTTHLQTIREEERTRIAREVHDELGQQLTGLKMDASWINKKIAPGDTMVHEKIDGMISLIDDTVKTVRRIASELRPGILDDLGLIAALEWQCKEFEKRTGINSVFITASTDIEIENDLATGMFRIYQETLTNIARHADATRVETEIENETNTIVLTVKDNGKGFEPVETKNKKTLGLIGMKERVKMFGGELIIISKPGKGTMITIKVPILAPINELVS